MMDLLAAPETWVSLVTLTVMEIVLGIDNIVFITILCGRLPVEEQPRARRLGILVALVSRLALLFVISWVVHLKQPIGEVFGIVTIGFSARDAILFAGGVFLVGKATHEIYADVEHPEEHDRANQENVPHASLGRILAEVLVLDVIFSLDSVVTAVGMVDHVAIMAAAMMIAVGIMAAFAGPVGDFVQNNPSVRILALAFLVMIGSMLVMEATGQHVSKGYLYAAMGFSLTVELVNLRRVKKLRAGTDIAA